MSDRDDVVDGAVRDPEAFLVVMVAAGSGRGDRDAVLRRSR
ncbi:hypothetical protein [Tsukamurella hominis]